MKGMGNTVKWPHTSNNPDPKQDTTKWCDFHADHGHSTPDCIALRLECNNPTFLKHFYLENKYGLLKNQSKFLF